MKIEPILRVVLAAAAMSWLVPAQTTPPAPSPGATPAATPPASGGTFSIEADIFGYESLQADSEAIACDIGGYVSSTGAPVGAPRAPGFAFTSTVAACDKAESNRTFNKGVVLVGSAGSTMANFQVWRTSMLLMQQLTAQGKDLKEPPAPPKAEGPAAPDLASSFTLAGQAITTIQGLLALFASNQTSTGIAGTIPDQALMNDVARQLRNLGIKVLMPDTYASFSFGGIDATASPFIKLLSDLMAEHSRLQTVMQKNQIIVNAAQKLQSDIVAVAADKAKIPAASAADKQSLQNDVLNLNAEINQIKQQLSNVDVGVAQATTIRAQSLISAMESFLANLTGGSLAFAAQTPAPSPAPAAPAANGSTTSPGGAPATQATPATPIPPASPATPPAAPAATAATPPIVAALLADGLARSMGVTADDPKLEPAFAKWRMLWLKTLESGGSLITTSNILGSKVHFSGGAVASYALFQFNGNVTCSGVAFAYGGYVAAKHFVDQMNKHDIDPRSQLVFLRGGCGADQP
jgi:hypothetical protein